MANNDRIVSANKLTILLAKRFHNKGMIHYDDLMAAIADIPTADAVEVVHSWWEKSAEGYKVCHHCKADVAIFSGHKNYCPNCGAKMDGGNDDGNQTDSI